MALIGFAVYLAFGVGEIGAAIAFVVQLDGPPMPGLQPIDEVRRLGSHQAFTLRVYNALRMKAGRFQPCPAGGGNSAAVTTSSKSQPTWSSHWQRMMAAGS